MDPKDEIAKLREALKPLADYYANLRRLRTQTFLDEMGDAVISGGFGNMPTLNDCRRAWELRGGKD